MKKIKRKFLILSSLAIIVVIAACSKKFLEKPPLGTLSPEIMATEKGVQGLLIIAYSDETLTLDNTDNTVDAWPKIEADLQFAVANLPDTWPGEPGRANVWAAKAMLAKVYMFEKKFTDAYTLLTDVIANGKTAGG